MQKKLLTLAVAGALATPGIALAQSSVEVYGFLSLSVGNWKFSEGQAAAVAAGTGQFGPATAVPSGSKWDVASGGSNVGVRGRESLGGGLTAWFQVETNAPFERSNNIANTSGFASRNSAIGVQGGFGNVFMGQWTTPWADLDSLWAVGNVGPWGPALSIIGRRETTGMSNSFNCANASGAGGTPGFCESVEGGAGVGHAFWRRVSNSVFYYTPVMGGFQGKIAWQVPQEQAVGVAGVSVKQKPQLFSGAVQWAGMGGRARIGAALDRHYDYTTPDKTDSGYALKGGYNFGVVDIGLAYEVNKYQAPSSECKAKQYGVAASVPVGMGAIKASYAVAKDIEGTYTGAVVAPTAAGAAATGTCGPTPVAGINSADNGGKMYSLGYEHRFSKRTSIGVGYATIKNDEGAGGNTFTWSGAPTNQASTALALPFGTDITTYFLNMTHRF